MWRRLCLKACFFKSYYSSLKANLNWPQPRNLANGSFLASELARFYLGRIQEERGQKAEAAHAYQEFLGHFQNSTARLLQIAEARRLEASFFR